MNVLVVPEAHPNDQFILQPIVKAMMAKVGKPHANVRVLRDERIKTVSEALHWKTIEAIIERYLGEVQLILICVDRDGEMGRRAKLDNIEQKAERIMPAGKKLLAVEAWEEVEAWVLAGLKDLPKDWHWPDIRQAVHVKEQFFERLAVERDLTDEPGQGRRTLGIQAAKQYKRIRQLCREDVAHLENRIREWLMTLV